MLEYSVISGDNMSSKDILNFLIKEGYAEVSIETMIEVAFSIYKSNRKNYNSYDFIPQNLIKLYYSRDNNHSDFSNIISTFKKKYIEQESKLEGVHTLEEINGLGLVYDYIRSDNWQSCANIYIIMVINLYLFSLTPYPEAGGKIRNADCFLKDSSIDTCPYNQIDKEIANLYFAFDNLLKEGQNLSLNTTESNEDNLIEYINKCLKLKCKLIQIHPFPDGNGRTMRALVNLLFKVAGLPPIYVKLSERKKYLEAMDKAIAENNYSYINKFYYYKICDSILELDVNKRINRGIKTKIRKRDTSLQNEKKGISETE